MQFLLSLFGILSLTLHVVVSQPATHNQMGHIREGDYIVQLPDALEDIPDVTEVVEFLLEGDGRVLYHFNATFVGAVVIGVQQNTTLARLRMSPLVRRVIQDHSFELDSTKHYTENWGLDRIDTQDLAMDGKFSFTRVGRNTEVYVLDTGLDYTHHEFHAVEPKCGLDAFTSAASTHYNCVDQSGHGTHVAGVIRGVNYGVAKLAHLVSVRVHSLHHGSSLSTVLAGFEYVLHRKRRHPSHNMIINLSLSGPHSNLMNSVADILVEEGVPVVVSAGNHNGNACRYSPAGSKRVITVGATNQLDEKAPFSNHGECVDIYAPGYKIQSAWPGFTDTTSRSATATLSGTSMAAAFVTGVVAQYMEAHPDWSPDQILRAIKGDSVKGKGAGVFPDIEEISIVNTGKLTALGQ